MKTRLSLIFAALVILLGAMVWVVQDRRTVTPALAAERALSLGIPAAVEPITASPPVPATIETAASPAPQSKPLPMVRIDASGEVRYVARAGDSVSHLAIALLGSDSNEHRSAVIAANPSLQTNPDRVLEGYAYSIDKPSAVAADAPVQAPTIARVDTSSEKPASNDKSVVTESLPKMKYTAQPGDTVGALAAHLLGGDTKANRDAIIAQNPSLQHDPDRLVAGQTYTIVAINGLAVDFDAPLVRTVTSQPDADELARLSVGRTLRYKAQHGDTVSKLAIVLLGSDTPANRELIIKSNPSLKRDPDHLVAGETYWISAPTAE